MKIILLENIRKVGTIGEIIEVKRGFARNYLIANQKALYASKENIKEVEKIKSNRGKKIKIKKKKLKTYMKKLMEKNILLRSLALKIMNYMDQLNQLRFLN